MEDNEKAVEQKQGDPLLIELVQQFPCLYDKQLKEYRNNNTREAAWIAIGQIMNMLPSECSKRWGQLRESFAREKRRRDDESRSGSGLSQRRGFSLFDNLTFLERHYIKRRSFSNVPNVQIKESVHRFNTGSTFDYVLNTSNANHLQWHRQPVGASLATSLPNVGSPVNTITTRFGDATPLTLPPDPIPAATYSSATALPPDNEASTVVSTCTGSHTSSLIETTSTIDLHPFANTSALCSSAILPPPPVTAASILPPVTMTTGTSSQTPLIQPPHVLVTAAPLPKEPILRSSETLTSTSPITPASTPPSTIPSYLLPTVTWSPPSPATTPTPPPRTPTSMSYRPSSSASKTASVRASESSISSSPSSPMSPWQIDDQCSSIPINWSNIDIPQSSSTASSRSKTSSDHTSPQQRTFSSSTPVLNSHCFTEPTSCYNKKLEKSKKADLIESSFLQLSSVIENHFKNRTATEHKTTQKAAASRSDEAFVSLIITELSELDEETKVIKKAKLLKVLYEQ